MVIGRYWHGWRESPPYESYRNEFQENFYFFHLINQHALADVKCFRDSSVLKNLVQEDEQELFEAETGILQ
jgi:hypothetical protein